MPARPINFAESVNKLRAMERALGVPFQITTAMAEVFTIQARAGFMGQKDPYGTAWTPLAKQRKADIKAAAKRAKKGLTPRGGVILVKSGKLRKSLKHRLTSATSFVYDIPLPYANTHQYGSKTRNIPARPFLPNSSRGVPRTWMAALALRVDKAFLLTMRDAFGSST